MTYLELYLKAERKLNRNEITLGEFVKMIEPLNAEITQLEIIRCKECKYWKQLTNYAGAPLSFGFCESDDMWRSLYGETTEVAHIDTGDTHYCGYAKRRLADG